MRKKEALSRHKSLIRQTIQEESGVRICDCFCGISGDFASNSLLFVVKPGNRSFLVIE